MSIISDIEYLIKKDLPELEARLENIEETLKREDPSRREVDVIRFKIEGTIAKIASIEKALEYIIDILEETKPTLEDQREMMPW